jgi:hypothetical protein
MIIPVYQNTGKSLQKSEHFFALRDLIDSLAEIDYKEIIRLSEIILTEESLDIRVIGYLAFAKLQTEGVGAFTEVLDFLQQAYENYGVELFPKNSAAKALQWFNEPRMTIPLKQALINDASQITPLQHSISALHETSQKTDETLPLILTEFLGLSAPEPVSEITDVVVTPAQAEGHQASQDFSKMESYQSNAQILTSQILESPMDSRLRGNDDTQGDIEKLSTELENSIKDNFMKRWDLAKALSNADEAQMALTIFQSLHRFIMERKLYEWEPSLILSFWQDLKNVYLAVEHFLSESDKDEIRSSWKNLFHLISESNPHRALQIGRWLF